jgi:PST family polysaccharide transporter
MQRLKILALKGTVWALSESVGVALLSFGVFAVLARLLAPQDFGVVTLAGVFIVSFNLLIAHSFADCLIQRAEIDRAHLDSVFWAVMAMSLGLAGLCWAGAAPLARWLHEPRLAEVLPALSLSLPLNALGSVQVAMFRRDLRFRAVALRSLAGRSVGAAVGLALAFLGFGVWSLVGQQLAGVATTVAALAVASPWRPRLHFSLPHLRELWGFGFYVSISQVVSGLGEQTVNLLVGALFGSTVLGYFAIAWRMAQLIRTLVSSAVYHVGLSAFARLQEDRALVAQALLKATRLSCLFGFPIGVGMAVLAGPIVTVLFGAKWQASVALLAILALDMIPAFYAMFFSACYRAMGRPGWVLALALVYVGTGIAAIYLLLPLGIEVVAAAWVAKSVLLLPMQIVLLRRLLHRPVRALATPPVAPLAASAIMAGAVIALRWGLGAAVGDAALLAIAVPAGALVYLAVIALIAPDLIRSTASAVRLSAAPSPAPG